MHPFHPHIRRGCLNHTVMMQYSLKRGLQVLGAPGTEAVFTKMKQLHDWSICEPQKALGYLMFWKEKRSGKIKGCSCVDGCKQHLWTSKGDSTSPTVATESVLLTRIIEAKETQHAVTANIPALLHKGIRRRLFICASMAYWQMSL